MDDFENDPDVKKAQSRVWLITDPKHKWHGRRVHLISETGRPVGVCTVQDIVTGEKGWGTTLSQMEIQPE
jgi:hypothetical protein